MAKVIRVRLAAIHAATYEAFIPLYSEGDDRNGGDCHVWFSADSEVTLYAVSKEVLYPLSLGSRLDQTFNFDGAVEAILIRSTSKSGRFAYKVSFAGTRYRDVCDPIPKRLPLPVDENSFEQRVLRAINSALESRGLTNERGRGVAYNDHDEDEHDDPEFGPGYAYSETAEEEIERAATAAVAERFKSGRVQRDPTPEPASVDLPEHDTELESGSNPDGRRASLHDPVTPGNQSKRDNPNSSPRPRR